MATVAKGYDLDYAWRAVGEAYRGAGYYLAAAEAGEPPGTWWGPGAERLGFADQLLLGEIDEVRAGRGADGRCHETLPVSNAPTSAVARRAAETGVRPWDLPARYAAEKASPEPVGSAATGQAPTRTAWPFAYTHDPRWP